LSGRAVGQNPAADAVTPAGNVQIYWTRQIRNIPGARSEPENISRTLVWRDPLTELGTITLSATIQFAVINRPGKRIPATPMAATIPDPASLCSNAVTQ
jgi:hypothetical protein